MLIAGVILLLAVMILLGAFFIRAMKLGFEIDSIKKQALTNSVSAQQVGDQLDEVSKAVDRLKDHITRDG